jgi:methyl-accepting chemotaxis protein
MAYKRSVLLINKRFQLRFCFYVCSWLFVLSLVYPWIIHTIFSEYIRNLSLDPMGPELTRLQSYRSDMTTLLVLLQLAFLAITFAVSIFVSHRIAGPLYKLRKFMIEASSGNLTQRLRFRQADHFQELADTYNEMMDRVGGSFLRSQEQMDEAIKQLEAGKTDQALTALKQARSQTAAFQQQG